MKMVSPGVYLRYEAKANILVSLFLDSTEKITPIFNPDGNTAAYIKEDKVIITPVIAFKIDDGKNVSYVTSESDMAKIGIQIDQYEFNEFVGPFYPEGKVKGTV